jgi:parvulin-like peptidyl-prolyl isomerase
VSPQPRRSTPKRTRTPAASAPARTGLTRPRKRLIALILAVFVVGAVILAAATAGLGDPSIPSGDVALVQDAPNGDITQDDFDKALDQAAAQLQLKSVPDASSPQYAQVKSAATDDLLLSRWVAGEADERGITVSDSQVADRLNQIIKSQFHGQKGFQQFLQQAHYSEQDARDRVRLQILSDEVQKQVLPTSQPAVSDDDVQNFYDANITQFQQPETRDFRLILNKDQSQVQAAADALAKDDSDANWAKVAKQYSTDPTTKTTGGLRQGVSKGQSEPALDDQVFSAPTGQLVGPFKGQNGYYLIEVQKITPAKTTPLDKQTSDQIRQQLQSVESQQIAQNFQTDFTDKWTSRTFCTSAFDNQRCANFKAPTTTCTQQLADQNQCPTPVTSIAPVAPGHATVFGTAQGLPQGPLQPASAQPTQLPGGVIPGTTPVTPGTAPATGAPPAGTSTVPSGG